MPQIEPYVVVLEPRDGKDRMLAMEPLSSKDNIVTYTGGTVVTDQVTHVVEPVPTVAALQSTVTVSISRPSKTSRISKIRVKLVVPVAALDADGKPTSVKSHENSADITYLFAEKSSLKERRWLDTEFRGLLADGPFSDVIQQLKSMY